MALRLVALDRFAVGSVMKITVLTPAAKSRIKQQIKTVFFQPTPDRSN